MRAVWWGLLVWWGSCVATIGAEPAPTAPPPMLRIQANGIYLREATDAPWNLTLTGRIGSLCGAYLLVLDAAGKVVHQGVIPHGEYPAERPLRIPVPADGVAGDYLVKVIGYQDDVMGLAMPLSDLPLEVYGHHSFAVAHELKAVPVWFRLPAGQTKLTLGGYKGHLLLRDAQGKTVADSKLDGYYAGEKHGQKFRFCHVMELELQPETDYQLYRECLYFSSAEPLYLVFERARWFVPDPRLDELKWWETVR
jgi:hypothetical protein